MNVFRFEKRIGRAFAAAVLLACAAACEANIVLGSRDGTEDPDAGGGAGGAGGGVAGDAAARSDVFTGDPCTDYATYLCELEQACNLLVFRNLLWGDLAVCKERRKLRCAWRMGAPGSNDTAARVGACASALSRFTCSDYGNEERWPESCGTPAGALGDGAACAVGSQCRGGGCFPAEGAACGTCSVLPGVGAACPNGVCDAFLRCHSGTCVVPPKLGDSCRYGGPLCGYGLACIGAASGQGKCLTHLDLGATCDPSAIECNDTQGLVCDNSTKLCRVDPGLPAPGESCLAGQYCRADAWCNFFLGRCEPRRREGQACGTSTGAPVCLQPATCVGNVCTLPNGNACQ
jgi:hypothetical protein